MSVELLPLRDELTTDQETGLNSRQHHDDSGEQDLESGVYNSSTSELSAEHLPTELGNSEATDEIHQVPSERPSLEGARNDGFLPAKSFSATSRYLRTRRHICVALIAIVLLLVPLAFTAVRPLQDPCGYKGSPSRFQWRTFFLIDIAFGTIPFSLAKSIDIMWAVVVGRVGQALLGWISYRICTDCLMWIMETGSVSYDLYTTLTFSWTSFFSLYSLFKAFRMKNRFLHKTVMVVLAINIIWVGSYPTIMGAMTGYIANNDINVRLTDGRYLSWTDFFHSEPVYDCGKACLVPFGGTTFRKDDPNATLWEELKKLDHTPDYPIERNIFYHVLNKPKAPSIKFEVTYRIGNATYDYAYTQQPGVIQCIANQTYRWGFCTKFIYIAAAGNAFWALSNFSIWLLVNRKSELCKKGRRLGKYRAAMDMAEVVVQELGPNICAYNDKELEAALEQRPPVKYTALASTDGNSAEDRPPHVGLSRGESGGAVKLAFGTIYGHHEVSGKVDGFFRSRFRRIPAVAADAL